MNFRLTIVILAVFVCNAVAAQDWSGKTYKYHEIYSGYVIKESGDTVYGYVQHNDRIQNQTNCVFYTDASKKNKETYKADEIKGYGVGDKNYRSIEYSGGLLKKPVRFALVFKPGRITRYTWYARDEGFIIQVRKKNETDEEYDARVSKDEIVWQKEGEKPFQHTDFALAFAKKMSKLVSDYPELSKKVADKEKGYRLPELFDIIDEYNKWWASKTQ